MEADYGVRAARLAWHTCTPAGRAQLATYLDYYNEKWALEDATVVSGEQVDQALKSVPVTKGRVDPALMRQHLLKVRDSVRAVEELLAAADRARLTLMKYPPPPPNEPVDDGTPYYRVYRDAVTRVDPNAGPFDWSHSEFVVEPRPRHRQLSPMEQVRDRFLEAQFGRLAARGAWLTCTTVGKEKLAAYRKWLEEKERLEEATHVGASRVEDALKAVVEVATFAPTETYLTRGKRRAITRDCLKKRTAVIQECLRVMKVCVTDSGHAQDARLALAPAPSLLPEDDGTEYYRVFEDAQKQFQEALDALAAMDSTVNKKAEMDNMAVPSFLRA